MLFEGGAESIEKFLTPVIRTNLASAISQRKTGCDFILRWAQMDSPSSQPQNKFSFFWTPLQAPNAHKHLAEGFL
jgi:hypothetical protein